MLAYAGVGLSRWTNLSVSFACRQNWLLPLTPQCTCSKDVLQRQFRTRVVKAIQGNALVDFLDYEVEFNQAHENGLYEIGGLGMLQDFLLRNFRAQMGEL
jgi:hypothetical protein